MRIFTKHQKEILWNTFFAELVSLTRKERANQDAANERYASGETPSDNATAQDYHSHTVALR